MGKTLYRSSMLNVFRLIVLAIFVFFVNDFYLETFTHEKFQLEAKFRIFDVLNYHYRYPAEFITFFLLIFTPAVYYAFIRGVRFREKGFVYNRGLPFLNREVLYEDVKMYKLLHPEFAISILTKHEEAFVIADNNVERVIAILDQHNIQGDLAQDDYAKILSNYRQFIYIVLTFTCILFVLKKFGLFFR